MRKKKRETFGDLDGYETRDYYKDRRVIIDVVKEVKERIDDSPIFYIDINFLKVRKKTDDMYTYNVRVLDHAILECSEDINMIFKILLISKNKRAKRWLSKVLSNYPFGNTGHMVGEYIDPVTGFLDIRKAERDQEEIWRKEREKRESN